MKISSQVIGEYEGEDKQQWDNRILGNLKKQIAEERPRCEICGRFFGIDDVLSDSVVSVTVLDTHFTTEQQWFEHRKCQL